MSSTPTPLETLNDPLIATFDQLSERQHLTPKQVAVLLQVSCDWLEVQRARGQSPPWIEVGKHMVRYLVGPLREWIRSNQANTPATSHERTQRKKDRIAGLAEEPLRGQRRWLKERSK
ncbi:hypothetical protein [Rhodanobacter sp. C03]|uniref:helix-turn-helix transcriptional regulator n=1 Tax=Rhodanobacter sp. C03 TaxID=1945858 RepID=UPI001C2C0700|nr:hypothetical protein [Rhodanobacter sp. C03]